MFFIDSWLPSLLLGVCLMVCCPFTSLYWQVWKPQGLSYFWTLFNVVFFIGTATFGFFLRGYGAKLSQRLVFSMMFGLSLSVVSSYLAYNLVSLILYTSYPNFLSVYWKMVSRVGLIPMLVVPVLWPNAWLLGIFQGIIQWWLVRLRRETTPCNPPVV